MEEKISKILNDSRQIIEKATTAAELENLRIKYLGKSGEITLLLKELPKLPLTKRKDEGRLINSVKLKIVKFLKEKEKDLDQSKIELIDVTAPGLKPKIGHLHLITLAIREIASIFEKIGFTRVRYPEIDWDWYVFEGLNMPPAHPARDEWETFFVDASPHNKLGQLVLTTHTTNAQLHQMGKDQLPIRIVNIGRCYRRQLDISHTPVFHQFDGLVIDKNLSIANLKGVLDYYVKQFFGSTRRARIRPFHFRFTEPSFEVDVSCGNCNGAGCRLCKSGWHELGGAGMVHPAVLKNGGIDPKVYSGFAWGWGVERNYMMKEGLKLGDIRILYENDIRFLEQF